MNGKQVWMLALAAMVLGLAAPAGAAEFFFKDGDTVVVMGDSITEQHLYSNYVEAWTLMRFPAWKITFHNVGIGGDTSGGGNGRFARDATEYKPTVLTVDFGMNDGRYRAFDQGLFDDYMNGLAGIARQAKEAKLRVAWITPSAVEKNEDGPAIEGYNRTLEKFSEGVKKIAADNGGLFVDQFHPCVALQDKARAAKASNRVGGGDWVHFSPPLQSLMASAILKGMSFPTLVAAVEIDASGKVRKSDNCKVTDAAATVGGVKFAQLDQALPFFPAESAAILAWSPILEEMNQYTLKVSGLTEGKYDVQLGGKTIAQYTNLQLAAGVNLAEPALKAGPVSDHVNAIWKAIREKNQFNHDQIYRGLVLANSTDKAKIASLREEVAKKDTELDTLRVIAPHTVEIVPVRRSARMDQADPVKGTPATAARDNTRTFKADKRYLAASGTDLLERLKQAPVRIEDTDHQIISPSAIRLDRVWQGDRCTFTLVNIGKTPLRLGNIILFDLAAHGLEPKTPIYGEGFQMLSQTAGSIASPKGIGGYADAGHYRIPEPDGWPTVYGVMTLDLGPGGHVLLGFTSCRRFIGRFSFNDKALRISVDPEGLELAPGETWKLEEFLAVTGPDRNTLLDQLAADITRNHPPLPQPPVTNRIGWCTWYGVGGAGNRKIVTESAERFASVLPELKFIQIDEGYTLEGDLLDVDPGFGDMKATIDAIRAKGFLPAIWVGPFVAAPQSHTLAEHPDWFVQGADRKPLVSNTVGFGGWKNGPWCSLDGSNPEAAKHLEDVFRTMREKWGITYFKLDANYWGAIHGGKHFDPKATRVEAYRRGMEAVVRGAGPGAVILGCNAPMWPSLGLVNAMRTANDIERSWDSFPATARENLNRGWQNGRLWVCDPDCVLLGGNTDIPPNIWRFHATVIHAVGGLIISGDKIENLKDEQLAILRKLIPPTGRSARFDNMQYEVGVTDLGVRQYHYAFNWGATPVNRLLPLRQRSRLKDFWTGEDLGVHERAYALPALPGRSARLIVSVPISAPQ